MSLGSVSGVFPGGRPSGLPEDIVQQLVEAKRNERMRPLEQDMQEANQQRDVYSGLDSQLTEMKRAADNLNDGSAFRVQSASSTNPEAVSASAEPDAAEGLYRVEVESLARAHNHVLGVSGDNSELEGIEDPDEPDLINEDMQISFHHGGEEYSYITDEDSTLNSLAREISEDGNGVTANAVNMGSGEEPQYVLTLKSESPGAGDNRITRDGDPENTGVAIEDTTENGNTLFAEGAAGQEVAQSGENAVFSVDGIQYERESNQVSDVVDGLTLDLNQADSEAEVSVDRDVEAVTEKVQSFVEAFNNTSNFISDLSAYDKEEDEAGPLMGSTLARSADSRMSRVITEPVAGTAEEPYQYLNQVGLELDREGNLEFDSGTFASRMREDPQAVENLFVGDKGAANKMASALGQYTDDRDGMLTYKLESIDTRVDRIHDRIEQEEERLINYRDRQVQKFTHMEQVISRYQSMEQELDNWISRMRTDE